ncbi:MAG: acyltransferase domain-containing protein [Clostridia bacterium]
MTYAEFLEKIKLDKPAIDLLLATKIDESKITKALETFKRSRAKFCERVNKRDNKDFFYLALFSRMAFAEREEWLAKGLSEEEFCLQFRDIAIWAKCYFRHHSSWGLEEIDWLCNSLSGKIIRFGRLQFEQKYVHFAKGLLGFSLKKQLILSVHIPEDGRLDKAAVKESFAKAREYFDCDKFFCASWLLSPVLVQLLPPDSNILQFQKFFHIYRTFPSKQCVDRVFDYCTCEYVNLATNTKLQRAVKEYLLDGGKTNEGWGFFVFDQKEIDKL